MLTLRLTMTNSTKTARNISVETALIVGLTPRRAMEKMVIDRFATPEPVVKKLMTKSSMDRVNASSKPVMIPGMISGRITFLNAYHGVAPKSKAAS